MLRRIFAWFRLRFSRQRKPCWWEDIDKLGDLICLTEKEPIPEILAQWTRDEKRAAARWAWASHLRANDNEDVERIPMPQCVKELPDQRW